MKKIAGNPTRPVAPDGWGEDQAFTAFSLNF
jgi:hypothetical protein